MVGFIIQNITEGLGIIAPVLRDQSGLEEPGADGPGRRGAGDRGCLDRRFLAFAYIGVLFLAVGTGAIFEVVYEIAKLIQKDTTRQPMPLTVFSGIVTGMLLLWVTGLMIK